MPPRQDNVNQIIEIQHKCDRVVSQPKGREGGGGGTPVTSYEFVMPTTKAFFMANPCGKKLTAHSRLRYCFLARINVVRRRKNGAAEMLASFLRQCDIHQHHKQNKKRFSLQDSPFDAKKGRRLLLESVLCPKSLLKCFFLIQKRID